MTGTLVVNGFAHFLPMFLFYNIWKCEKTSDVLTFAGGIETRTLVWNGLICNFINSSLIHSFPRHPFSTPWKHQETLMTYKQFLGFLNLYQHEKNQFILSAHFWDQVNFRVLSPDWPHPFLTMPTQKNFWSACAFRESVPTCKNRFIPSVHISDTVNFRVPWLDWSHSFVTIPIQKFSITFYFAWICTSLEKIVNSTCSFLWYNLESQDQIYHTHFWPWPAKNFRSNFDFSEFVSAWKKWG